MKTLDDQVPSGYFEALPNKTLARLEGKDMQSTTGTSERKSEVQAPPPVAATAPASEPAARDEDSGLHDIRSLAQSTKQRLSNKRVTASPVRTDEDVLAASSASFKGVALPEPAKMVSLPSLDELPSKKEILAKEKAAKKQAVAAVATELPAGASAPAPAAMSFGAHMTARKKSKAPLAMAGALVAAAAGVAIYFATQQKSDTKSASANETVIAQATPTVQAPPPPPAAAPAPQPEPPKAAEAPPPAEIAKDEPAQGAAAVADTETKPEPAPPKPGKHVATKTKAGPSKMVKETEKVETPPVEKKQTDDKKKPAGAKGSGEEGEPSFDALLKEAGVDQTKKEKKPVLANKSLSGGDFKKGMDAVQAKAQACYKGTQGTAQFKLSVAPSGQVQSVTMTGMFAGKPEGACVQAAVKSATFPPWDGGPQSFSYSYLLAE